jgi:hypothetical protein
MRLGTRARVPMVVSVLAATLVTGAAGGATGTKGPGALDQPVLHEVSVAAPAASVVSEEDGAVVLRLDAPPVSWTSANGYLYPAMTGLGTLSDLARPALPVRVLRVGVPAGAVPVLTILDSDSVAGPSGRIGPAQKWEPILPGSDDRVPVNEEDASVYESDAWYPAEAPVRLGESGSLREQPYVELFFTPVLANPLRGSTRQYRSVTVRVDFGAAAARSQIAPLPDPDFESVYEAGIVNAKQASRFRVVSAGAEGAPGVATAPLAQLAPEATNRYKLTVNHDGIYRLGVAWITANAPSLLGQILSRLRVDCQGRQIAISVVDVNGDGTLNNVGGSDYIEFYGQALTWDILDADEWNSGDYTDDNVYWLYADTVAAARAPTRASAPQSIYSIPTEFTDTAHHEVNRRFVLQVPADPVDHWYQDPPVAATNSNPASVTFTVATPGASTTAPGNASVTVKMLGDNYLNNLHRTALLVNDIAVSPATDWNGFVEFTQGPASFAQSVLNNDGTPETSAVKVSLPLGCSPSCLTKDTVFLNWIDLTYARKFRVDVDADGDGTVLNDQVLTFSASNQNTQFHITGLSQPAAAIYEITKTLSGSPLKDPIRITGAAVTGASAPYSIDFQITADGTLPATRRFVVATVTGGSTGVLVPAAVKQDGSLSCPTYCVSDLHNPGTGADWLAIARASDLDGTVGSAWQQLLARRASQGLAVKVVDIEDVYDEFSYGIPDPQAIRDFLAYVYASWPRPAGVPLRYAVLLGDASFDYKNSYGNPQNQNRLSSYLRSASESSILGWMSDETYFAAVSGGDALPDFFLGRWPIHNVAETDAVAQKILNYETAATGQTWQQGLLFIADDDDAAFELVQQNQIDWWLSPNCSLCTYASPWAYHRVFESQIPPGPPTPKQRIISNINGQVDVPHDIGDGVAVVTYVGHGAWQDWGGGNNLFHTESVNPDDVDALTNAAKLPLVLVADCLSGGFAVTSRPGGCSNDATRSCLVGADCVSPGTCTNPAPQTDLRYVYADDMLVTANKGAVAVIAPSHLTFSQQHTLVLDRFFGDAYGPKKTRNLGALTTSIELAFASVGDTRGLRSYALFGDPAVNLGAPAPRPPASVTATPGNHQVSLSWTASPDAPVTYNVYQASSVNGPYVRVATSWPSTSYVATGLTNCTTYYFFVTALKSNFEGAWSHLNQNCGGGGLCLSATPMSPLAPSAPTGVSATDQENGGTIRVQWSANPVGDDVNEYRVYIGTSPNPGGPYFTAGGGTSLIVAGLTNGVTYYAAVSAVNCSHGEGSKSIQTVTAVPHRIEGIKPPNAVDDLRITRSGANDLRLQWTAPPANIYLQPYPFGSPAVTLASQEVYSGTTPNFVVDAAHKIGTLTCPCASASSFIHPGAATDPSRHYYIVVAIDSLGNRSGVTHELPKGVDQLTVQRSGTNLMFSWPAVTLDVDGRKTQIASYSLYGRLTNPMKRSDVPANLILGNIVTTSTTTASPAVGAGQVFYYSLIATDSKGALSPW